MVRVIETLYELKASLSSISSMLSSDWIPVTVDGKKIESVVLTDDMRVEIKTKEE